MVRVTIAPVLGLSCNVTLLAACGKMCREPLPSRYLLLTRSIRRQSLLLLGKVRIAPILTEIPGIMLLLKVHWKMVSLPQAHLKIIRFQDMVLLT